MQGSLAQFAAADARLLAHKPASLSLREAAVLPLAAITAREGLVDRARIQPGQTVLVQGGGGGVGHVAVQIALARGAKVFATAFGEDLAFVRGLAAVTQLAQSRQLISRLDSRTVALDEADAAYDAILGRNGARRQKGKIAIVTTPRA